MCLQTYQANNSLTYFRTFLLSDICVGNITCMVPLDIREAIPLTQLTHYGSQSIKPLIFTNLYVLPQPFEVLSKELTTYMKIGATFFSGLTVHGTLESHKIRIVNKTWKVSIASSLLILHVLVIHKRCVIEFQVEASCYFYTCCFRWHKGLRV